MKNVFKNIYKRGLFGLILMFVMACSNDDGHTVMEPSSEFSYIANDLEVSFTSKTQYAVQIEWDFGDGETSTDVNPIHTYAAVGDYTIALTAVGEEGTETAIATQMVSLVQINPEAGFFYVANEFEVTFTNTSERGVSFSWDFGDGETSTEENPVHAFAEAGAYSVTLTVTGVNGSIPSTVTQTVAVGATIIKLEGTIFGHESSWGNDPSHYISAAFDGDVTTFVDAPGPEGWVGYDFGEGKLATISSVKYAPRDGLAWRMVNAEIRGSNDPTILTDQANATYVTLYTITDEPPVGELTEADVSATEGYRFIYFYTADGYGNISELELYGVFN